MSLLDLPIPPRPTAFTPDGAPPGVAVNLTAFKAFVNGETVNAEWWRTRTKITPRLLLIHTNGASKEGGLASQSNWANAAPGNTHPHYSVNAPQPTKFVPTDREGIGNYRVSDWSIVVETADAGWPTPGNAGGFLYDHAEIVARICAYESIVWGFPLDYPDAWDGTGTACHTEPFGYPYWTNSVGKPCPGVEKKRQVRDEILPRARQIRNAWVGLVPPVDSHPPTPPEDDMQLAKIRVRGYANQFVCMPATAETNLLIGAVDEAPVVVDCDPAAFERAAGFKLKPTADGN